MSTPNAPPDQEAPAVRFLAAWHDMFERKAIDEIDPFFAPDCEMVSPVVWKLPLAPGYAPHVVRAFFGCVTDFTYRRDWIDPGGHDLILEFEAVISGRGLVGIDRITVDEAGRAVRFEVMIRPLNALINVGEAMRARLGAG